MMRKEIVIVPLLIALASCGIFKKSKDKSELGGERLSVLTFDAKTEVDPDLATTIVSLPPPVQNTEWTQAGGSAARALGHLAISPTFERIWSVSIGNGSDTTRRLTTGPVVSAGSIYTIDTSGNVRAFSTANGSTIWTVKLRKEDEKESLGFGGGVAVANGRVYATTGYGIAAALDAATGTEAWRVDLKVPLRGAPTVDGAHVFVMTQDNQMLSLAAATGESVWETVGTVEPAGLLGASGPAVDLGTAVIGFSSGELTAVRVENGRTVWQDALNRTGSSTALASLSDIDAPAVIDRGRVFAIGHGGRMVALELSTGQRVWERNLAGTSMPWVAGEFVFAVTIEGELVCVTRGEGKVKWVTQLQRWRNEEKRKDPIIWQGPVLASDGLFLTNSEGEVAIVSPIDGGVRSTTEVAKAIFLPPVIADSTLYILSDDGKLSAYR